MADAVHLMNVKALLQPEVQKLFEDAVGATGHAAPGGFNTVTDEIFYSVGNSDSFYVVMGIEDGKPAGLIMGHYPTGQLYPYPTTYLVYARSSAVKKAMLGKLIDILKERGYTSMWAMNATDKPDDVWERAFATPGIYFKPLGTVYEIGIE